VVSPSPILQTQSAILTFNSIRQERAILGNSAISADTTVTDTSQSSIESKPDAGSKPRLDGSKLKNFHESQLDSASDPDDKHKNAPGKHKNRERKDRERKNREHKNPGDKNGVEHKTAPEVPPQAVGV
jgi:hypothetical protein